MTKDLSEVLADIKQLNGRAGYIIPIIERGDGIWDAQRIKWNRETELPSLRKITGVRLNSYNPVCAWRYGGIVYRRR